MIRRARHVRRRVLGPPMRLGSRAEIAILVLSRPGSFAVPTIGPPAAVRDLSFR